MAKGSQKLQIIPLGGLGEIGKNMTVIRVDDEILLIVWGKKRKFKFLFSIKGILRKRNIIRKKSEKSKIL